MIYTYYKSNQPIVLYFLPIVILVLWIPGFIKPAQPPGDEMLTLFDVFYNFLGQHSVGGKILAMALILGEAVLLNYTFNKSEFIKKETYLPALFYALFCSYFAPTIFDNHVHFDISL